MKKSLSIGCLGVLGMCGSAAAAPISCVAAPYNVSASVAGASACERLGVANGNSANDSELLVNQQGFSASRAGSSKASTTT